MRKNDGKKSLQEEMCENVQVLFSKYVTGGFAELRGATAGFLDTSF